MADKDNKDMDGAREKAAVSRDHSPIASTRTEVDDDREERASYVQQTAAHEKAHAYETEDDTDHGEPDWEAEEAGETVPGRQLDRQLSAVRSIHTVSPCPLVKDAADGTAPCLPRCVMSTAYKGLRASTVCAPRRRAFSAGRAARAKRIAALSGNCFL